MVARALGRGALIVFEGVDRSGKSTQSESLARTLQAGGVDAELWRFPDRTTATGQMIDGYLRRKADLDDAAVHLLFSANRWEKRPVFSKSAPIPQKQQESPKKQTQPLDFRVLNKQSAVAFRQLMLDKLRGGTTLIVDRYAYSGAVFTAAKRLAGLDIDWCKAADRGLPAPDAVLYLDLSAEAAAARGGFGQERYEKEEMQQEVRRLYRMMQKSVPGWTTIDAARPVDELSLQIAEIARRLIHECRTEEVKLRSVWIDAAPSLLD